MADDKSATQGMTCMKEVVPASSVWTTKREEAVKLRMGDSGVAAEKPVTIPYLFDDVVSRSSDDYVAMGVKRGGTWRTWTYRQYHSDVRKAAKSFIKLGLERFRGVGIIGFNAPEWYISYIAAMYAGGLSVGIYTTNSWEACSYVASDSEANVIVVENDEQLQKILKAWDDLPHLKAVIQFTGQLSEHRDNLYTWEQFLQLSEEVPDSALQERLEQQAPNTSCAVIYTSGTTGVPKGVMLSHDNLTWTAKMCNEELHMGFHQEVFVSYLPLSHVAAQNIDLLMPMASGASVYFAQPDALKGTLGETWKEIRPTGVFGVPRVWEKIMNRLQEAGRQSGWLKRKLAAWAKAKGLKGSYARQNKTAMPMFWGLANKLVFKRVYALLGLDRCRQYSSGGAPIAMEVTEYFASLDIQFYETYGSSETTGPTTFGKAERFRLGSVGSTFNGGNNAIIPTDSGPNVSVRESALRSGEGEICVYGRNVFMGYLNKEDKTREVFTEDGWFRTGDIGKPDDDGFWYITGRIKEIIITAGGENIAPVPIEEAVKSELPIISWCMVVGDKRKFLSMLMTLKVTNHCINLAGGQEVSRLSLIDLSQVYK